MVPAAAQRRDLGDQHVAEAPLGKAVGVELCTETFAFGIEGLLGGERASG
ncbi:MAG TPA: hypothetical protein VMU34_03980 [Mycobacterium sp.]|nr:hypothetical protein [Mycobacterium sp.]